jgi:hypothetical protein
MSVQVTIVYNRSNPFGIRADAELLEAAIQSYNRTHGITFAKVVHADLLEPPSPTHICIHLEIPSATWMPWAQKNVMMVNTEWWVPAWDCLLPRFDEVYLKTTGVKDLSGTFIPWRSPVGSEVFGSYSRNGTGCLWLLGGSKNKRDAAVVVIPQWKPEYPTLNVYTTTPLALDTDKVPKNVILRVLDLEQEARHRLQASHPIHLALSRSEGFGLAAAEAEAAGAYLLLNDLSVYTTSFQSNAHVGWIKTPKESSDVYTRAEFAVFTDIQNQLDTIFQNLPTDFKEVRAEQADASKQRQAAFTAAVHASLKALSANPGPLVQYPHPLKYDECPPISVITLTYNRRKFIDVAFHNIILTDYPKDKIEWIVVDDSDDVEEQCADKIAKFANRAPVAQVVYVPLNQRYTIGGKRNIGVSRATHDIILMMDDDDHYPTTSFRRRVGWLLKHPWKPKAVGCSTIACYDLVKGVSAVNTPPWELGPAQRVSEATLTFYKSFWDEKRFPFTNTSEGEGFLAGREHEFLDAPPQQMLVALSHQGNASGRRIPSDATTTPGCFWNFPKEYLIWLHKLAGIEVEETQD